MKVFRSLDGFDRGHNATATIGTFDGVHLGHQKILGRLLDAAKEVDGESVVISFHPHPRLVLQPEDKSLRMLQAIEEKIAALDAFGIDKLLLIPFTREFAEQDSQEFISQVLIQTVGIKRIVIGYDHHFGKNRSGGLKELQAGAELYGFEVEEIPAEQIDNANVSSTKIRQALLSGDIATASRFLGYDYGIRGTVVEGEKLGRTIGYPTANILPDDPHKLIPGEGVYLARLWVGGEAHFGMLNIGKKPTVGDHFPLGIEIHLFNFDQNIYGKSVRVEFLDWIRPDVKFASLDELVDALHRDRDASLALIEKRNG
ncbi:MAG: bifunctional riboflavin kinase/FAD synthetase [Bacteroidetes bacterium]|nr:bifunctional riboflavin kinase/FAD synthetase [Bacteroidota bacterium]MBL0019276.1 bifunctional riboflavin kinase/FAD synthetase [Bacteroidota bacterium]